MTGSMFAGASPEETERRVEQWAAEFAAKADRYQNMQAELSQVSATEWSRDGIVRVTVDSAGAITDLAFSDQLGRLRPDELATEILGVMRRAQSLLAGRVERVMQDTVGDDEATVQAVVDSYHQRFPEPPPEPSRSYGGDLRLGEVEDGAPAPPRASEPPRRQPRRDQQDDDDGWGGPILRS